MVSFRQLAVVTAVADGARIARKGARKDGFSPLDGKVLANLDVCSQDKVDEMKDVFTEGACTLVSAEWELELPADGSCTKVSVACAPWAAEHLLREGHATKVSDDAGGFYREKSGTAKSFVEAASGELLAEFYSDWRDLETQMARVHAAVAASEGAAELGVVGQSVEGRDIEVVRLRGKGWSPGMPRLVLTFNVHAREWITGMAGVYAVEKMSAMARDDPEWLAGKEIALVPMVNPDGKKHSEGFWRFQRKNMRVVNGTLCTTGVDLNRNVGSSWGKFGAASRCAAETYRGEAAFSEPETQALDKLFREAPMTAMFDVHSYGQMLLYAWSWTKDPNPRAAEFESYGGKVHAAMEARHGESVKFGPSAATLYQASGVIPDYATELGALGFTFEVRPSGFRHLLGFTPPKSDILLSAEETFDGLLAAVANLDSV